MQRSFTLTIIPAEQIYYIQSDKGCENYNGHSSALIWMLLQSFSAFTTLVGREKPEKISSLVLKADQINFSQCDQQRTALKKGLHYFLAAHLPPWGATMRDVVTPFQPAGSTPYRVSKTNIIGISTTFFVSVFIDASEAS